MKIYELEDRFPKLCSWRYQEETVFDVLKKDSGYVKDLIMLNDKFALSESAYEAAKEITRGFTDNRDEEVLSDTKKVKNTPYDFDFNDEKIQVANNEKIAKAE